jgi:hypothetical protein
MVSVDSDNMGGGQKDMSPCVKSMDNREEFSIVDIVISLRLVEGAGYTSNGSESSPVILLGEDGLLRPSTRHSRRRISVSRAFEEYEGTQQSSLLSCLARAEPQRQAWL